MLVAHYFDEKSNVPLIKQLSSCPDNLLPRQHHYNLLPRQHNYNLLLGNTTITCYLGNTTITGYLGNTTVKDRYDQLYNILTINLCVLVHGVPENS